jgi:hypothetical protein
MLYEFLKKYGAKIGIFIIIMNIFLYILVISYIPSINTIGVRSLFLFNIVIGIISYMTGLEKK